jgi:hypothetical protein
MKEEDHDKIDASRDHADPSQGSPVVDAVPEAEDDQNANADKQGLEDCQATSGAWVHCFRNVNTCNDTKSLHRVY